MKKLFTTILLVTALLLANVASAGYRAEYKAKYPPRVTVKTAQNEAGKMVTTETYKLFFHKYFTLEVVITDDYRYALISYRYHDKPLRIYEGFTCGDGNRSYTLPLFYDPIRDVHNGYVTEIIASEINPTEFKKNVIVHAHSKYGGSQVMIASADPAWPVWLAALEDAEKLLADK